MPPLQSKSLVADQMVVPRNDVRVPSSPGRLDTRAHINGSHGLSPMRCPGNTDVGTDQQGWAAERGRLGVAMRPAQETALCGSAQQAHGPWHDATLDEGHQLTSSPQMQQRRTRMKSTMLAHARPFPGIASHPSHQKAQPEAMCPPASLLNLLSSARSRNHTPHQRVSSSGSLGSVWSRRATSTAV